MRGFTLGELLVVMTLSILMLGLLGGLLVPTLRLYRRQSNVAEAQQAANLALSHLRNSILDSLPETVSTLNSETLSVRPGDPDAPFGSLGERRFFARFDVYRWDQARQLLTVTPVSPSTFDFTTLRPLPDPDFPASGAPGTRPLTRNVTNFAVSFPVTFPIDISVTVSPKSEGTPVRWTVQQKIMPTGSAYPAAQP